MDMEKINLTQKKIIQELCVEILDECVRIFREEGLEYYLVGGTLLGAVRHKGFIPWDDDLDIAMPREDFESFKKMAPVLLNDNFRIHGQDEYSSGFILNIEILHSKQLIQDDKIIGNVWIDVFPLDNAVKVGGVKNYIFNKVFRLLGRMKWNKLMNYEDLQWKGRLFRKLTVFISYNVLDYWRNFIAEYYNCNNNAKYYINWGSHYSYKKQTIARSIYEPAVLVEFEGKKYNAPNNWDFLLSRIYGNYMKIPENKMDMEVHKRFD